MVITPTTIYLADFVNSEAPQYLLLRSMPEVPGCDDAVDGGLLRSHRTGSLCGKECVVALCVH